MYNRDYLVDFVSLIKKDTTEDTLKNIFTEDYPFKLQLINLILFMLIFCSGYILQKLVVSPYITSSNERAPFKKEIMGKDFILIILKCIFVYIFGNFMNTFSLKKGINFGLFILIFYGTTFGFQKFKSISEVSDVEQKIIDIIKKKGKKISTSTYIGLACIGLLFILVLIYGFHKAYESGIIIHYLVFFLIMAAIFVLIPIYNGKFVLNDLISNISFVLLLCCRFDGKLNSIISGLLAGIIVNEISWQKK